MRDAKKMATVLGVIIIYTGSFHLGNGCEADINFLWVLSSIILLAHG